MSLLSLGVTTCGYTIIWAIAVAAILKPCAFLHVMSVLSLGETTCGYKLVTDENKPQSRFVDVIFTSFNLFIVSSDTDGIFIAACNNYYPYSRISDSLGCEQPSKPRCKMIPQCAGRI